MNAEITDNAAVHPAGWIFFDGECRFCVASRRRWGRIFERRGFVWLPLQTPGTAERLGVAPELLMAAMWVLPAGAPPLNGVNAWIGLMRHVWWLKPFAVVLSLPGINRLARAVYRVLAANRHCIGGVCKIPRRHAWRDRLPLMFPLPVWFHHALGWCVERRMKVPLVSVAQVRMRSEGLAEAAPACEALPTELSPRIRSTEEQIRRGLPAPGPSGAKDLRCCHRHAPHRHRVFFEMP